MDEAPHRASSPHPGERRASPPILQAPLVLVVDDSDDARTICAEYLGYRGFRVAMAEHGLQALDFVGVRPPDLVVMDLAMPVLGGLEAARRLRSQAATRHIPLIALTAYATKDARDDALAAGFDKVLTKPCPPVTLDEEIRRLLGSRPEQPSAPTLVLIVDDLEDHRALYREYLAFQRYQVVTAVNGREGLDKAIALSPDIVVMDLAMPVLDGLEAIRRLRDDSRIRHIPVIVLTARAMQSSIDEALAAGSDAVLTKPCPPRDLAAEIVRRLSQPRGLAAEPEGRRPVR